MCKLLEALTLPEPEQMLVIANILEKLDTTACGKEQCCLEVHLLQGLALP